MSGNGASGFMDGFMSGLGPGKMLADAVAQRRAAHRMNAVQDQIDSGVLNPNTAEGQKAIQIAIRNAQQPLSNRGLDDSYGSGQYDRVRGQGVMRANQLGADQIKAGDMPGGIQTSANGLLSAGDIAGGLQQQGFADQVRVGQDSIKNDGSVDTENLAKGTARVAAMDGNPGAAMQWDGAQKTEHYAALSGMAGNLLLRAKDTPIKDLGGYIGPMAKLVGLGEVQYSPSQDAWIAQDGDGNVTAKIDKPSLEEFATHWSQNPENIPGIINAYRAKQADQQAALNKHASEQYIDAGFKVATAPFARPVSAAMRTGAATAMAAASKAGWKIETGTKATNDAKPGVATYVVQGPNGEPLNMTVDVSGDTPVTTITTAEGMALPPTVLAKMGAGAALAQSAVEKQAYIDAHNAALQDRQSQFNDVEAWHQHTSGAMQQGAPQMTPGAAAIHHALKASPYKSKYPALDTPQLMQESGGHAHAVSPKGARGMAQLMPATARALEQHLGMPPGATDHNPAANVAAGLFYRDHLIDTYRAQGMDPQHAMALGLAAYNAGPGRVAAYLSGKADLPAETKQYVASIMSAMGGTDHAPAQAAPAQPAAQPTQIQAGGVAFTNPFAAYSPA